MQSELFNIIRDNFNFSLFAMLLFFIGFCLSFIVDHYDIKMLKLFPAWFMELVSRIAGPGSGFIRIFTFIFLFNSISIMLYMASGVFIIFPFMIAVITGMNIGLSVLIPPVWLSEQAKNKSEFSGGDALKFAIFTMIVLMLEVIAFSIGLGMGMSIAVSAISDRSSAYLLSVLLIKLSGYVRVCVPMLFLSAYLETTVITGARPSK